MLDAEKVFMYRALELARMGAGLVSPNPMVGALLVKDGRVIGEGYHLYERRKHAESYAIEQAGREALGSTLYCSLEPCCHHGRTPPCTDSLIAAGIGRAVIATRDPDPRVNGQGIEQLRRAGIDVDVGLCEQEAIRLNEAYSKFIVSRMPFLHGVIEDECGEDGGGWIPSGVLLQELCSYDGMFIGKDSEAARHVLTCQVTRKRHRPEVVVAGAEKLEQVRAGLGNLSKDIISIVIGGPDAPEQHDSQTPPPFRLVGASVDKAEPLMATDSLLSSIEILGKINVTSAAVLPGAFDLSDPTNFEELDKLTLVLPTRMAPRLSSRLSFGDLEFDFDDVSATESGEYTELTGYPRLLEIA
jgi:pyrimidine deaminase RibD-like protein